MKKQFLSLFVLLVSVPLFAQSLDEKMQDLQGKWTLDANGQVSFVRMIEQDGTSSQDLFMRALNYFTNEKNLPKSSVVYKDASEGLLVVKGVMKNIHQDLAFTRTYLDASYQFTIDVKDGKARIKCTVPTYERKVEARNQAPSYSSVQVETLYPANVNAERSTIYGNAFHKTFLKVTNVMDAVEKEMLSGQPLLSTVRENW